ncbi:UPF0158 family protein [Thalassotalea sp. ND16A]|uniref:UPF0158 family protein n=1 Tax=Thalassotalea sp. ND16A TaxID=1535422 RepID=UPI00051D51F8|nr:UPF0158 family protein [Thalassotalea sp. ND16A]KGJ90483.1 hypothetical protein ND16A_1879 [Thalassotalea sp. ND16A]
MSNQQQNPIKVNLSEIVDALEFSGMSSISEIVTYLDTSTGKIIVDMDESEFGFEAKDDLPDDLFENDRYLQLPDKYELDLGKRLALRFVEQFLPQQFDYAYRIFSKSGAYRRFKLMLEEQQITDKWYQYEQQQTELAIKTWCDVNSIEYDESNKRQ